MSIEQNKRLDRRNQKIELVTVKTMILEYEVQFRRPDGSTVKTDFDYKGHREYYETRPMPPE